MKQILLILIIVAASINVWSGDVTRKGTTGAHELLIPIGASSIATGGAFLSSVSGLEAIYYNPAGLDMMKGSEGMFSYMNYIADINIAYFAVGTQISELGSVAFSYKTMDFGDIPVTTFENPDGTGETYSPSFHILSLTYSKVLTDRISSGVNFKFIHEGIMNTAADGFALDFGVQYRFDRNLSIGTTVKNIGSNMEFSGEDLKIKTEVPNSGIGTGNGVYEGDTEAFNIPSYFELSGAYILDINEQNNIDIAAAFRSNNSFEDEFVLGLEYDYSDMFFMRGGYNFLLEHSKESIYDFSLGAGLKYQTAEGISFVFDYAYRNVKDFPTQNHVFTIKLGIE